MPTRITKKSVPAYVLVQFAPGDVECEVSAVSTYTIITANSKVTVEQHLPIHYDRLDSQVVS